MSVILKLRKLMVIVERLEDVPLPPSVRTDVALLRPAVQELLDAFAERGQQGELPLLRRVYQAVRAPMLDPETHHRAVAAAIDDYEAFANAKS